MHVSIHVCIRVFIFSVRIRVFVFRSDIHMQLVLYMYLFTCMWILHVYVKSSEYGYANQYWCIRAYICSNTHMCAYIYTDLYVSVYMYMKICIYAYLYTRYLHETVRSRSDYYCYEYVYGIGMRLQDVCIHGMCVYTCIYICIFTRNVVSLQRILLLGIRVRLRV